MTKEMRIFAAQANEERSVTMARPIKETPILYGEDAKRFLKAMENVKPASQEEKQRVRAAYEKMKKIASFVI